MVDHEPARWNHNIHYHRVILDAVPSGARTALDVGTGNGLLAVELHRVIPSVTGIDADAAVLSSARAEDAGVNWVQGDVMTYPFPPASFDVVASIATIHHLPDLDRTLARLAELTAPGGVLAVIGLARSSRPTDALHDVAGLVRQWALGRRRVVWEHSAPTVWPPPHTYSEVRQAARRTLPGSTWTRLPLWRYALIWTREAP